MHPITSSALGTPPTLLLGLIGEGIGLSRTPAMHEAEGLAQGYRTIYRLFDTAAMDGSCALPAILEAAEQCGFAGLNITYPFKQAVLAHLDEIDPAAAVLGAVNTVAFRNGRRVGTNTDRGGFYDAFSSGMARAQMANILQIGAGGAGFAVAFALIDQGAEQLAIFDLQPERAANLAGAINAATGESRARAVSSLDAETYDGIVNATPIGTARHPGTPFPSAQLTPATFVVDVNYFPLETALLKAAREKGCRTMGGAGMAIGQAVRAFACFTGLDADPERMAQTFHALGPA